MSSILQYSSRTSPVGEFQAQRNAAARGLATISAGRQLGLLFAVRTSPRRGGSPPQTPEIGAAKVSDESRVDPIDRTEKIHLADVDAVVTEDRVGHRNMEIDVRDRNLQEVIVAA